MLQLYRFRLGFKFMLIPAATVWLICLILISALPIVAHALQPKRPDQESFLRRAVFADGRLWLLSDAGELSSIVEGNDSRTDSGLSDPVADICVQSGHLEAITCTRENCTEWSFHQQTGGNWLQQMTIQTQGDALVGMACSAERMTIVTSKRLVEVSSGNQRSVTLSETLETSLITSLFAESDNLFIGINMGEWGGGLRRVNRRTGKVDTIERNISGELCGGPLNTECDPVNGIAPEPWKPNCIAAAVGLVHFRPRGRIVEVCEDEVQRIYLKPIEYESNRSPRPDKDEPFASVAFFGLTRVGDELWAAGIDGIYRMKAPGEAQLIPLPKFRRIGNIDVSFEIPNVILVLTTINRRMSVSGDAPLLVPR
ncbi:MAG: hypothetical protein AB9866_19515 [Syntrophobacteraceae bacterium]